MEQFAYQTATTVRVLSVEQFRRLIIRICFAKDYGSDIDFYAPGINPLTYLLTITETDGHLPHFDYIQPQFAVSRL